MAGVNQAGRGLIDASLHESWAPAHLSTAQVVQLGHVCQNEAPGRPNGVRQRGVHLLDLGHTFTLAAGEGTRVLKYVAQRFTQGTGERVRTVDIGAGRGIAAWQLLAAGAHIECIERDVELARALGRELAIAAPFLRPGETVAQCSHIFLGDVLGKHFGTVRDTYDVALASNVLHMMHPDQVPLFFARLAAMLRPGGMAFVRCNAPCLQVKQLIVDAQGETDATAPADTRDTSRLRDPDAQNTTLLYDLYARRREQGEAFPGHVVGASYTRTRR
jgi:2-polyprenyl-3-methyl-5-hydroxy-6-metoxy-1,4-benzoquinol methylase